MSEFSVIGKRIALIDAAGKTTGQGKYTDDLSLPGMLIGKILHSPYPHARVKKIDPSRALALEGVVANQTDRNLAEIRAKSVSGVFSVEDHLQVER